MRIALFAAHGRRRCSGRVGLGLVVGLALLPWLSPRSAAALTVREERVKEQQADNRRWERAARDLQSRYYRRAEALYKDKKYNQAADLYRKVLDISYTQWVLRVHRRVGRIKGEERRVTVPALRKERKSLVTPLNQKAKDRLEDIEEARLTAAVENLYEQAQDLLAKNRPGEAYARLKRIDAQDLPRTLRKKYAARVAKQMKSLETEAGALLDHLAKAIAEKDLDRVREHYHAFRQKYGDFAACDALHERFVELLKSDELRALLRREAAEERLARALKAFEAEQYPEAFDQLKELAALYPDTEAGRKAADKVAEMRADKALMRKLLNQRAARVCEGLLRKAVNYRANGLLDEARRTYRKIIERYPDTDYADEAQRALQDLDGGVGD